MAKLYTIGYSPFTIDGFLSVIKHYGVDVIIDVRSLPYSEYHADYNKENIENALKYYKIYYRNYSREFGARQTDTRYLSEQGYLDFEAYAKSPAFQDGFANIENSLAKGYAIALMCAEKDPCVCHRCIMISRVFYDKGYDVRHILAEGQTIGQDGIELQLLDKYFPDRNQLSLFGNEDTSLLIASAYKKRNAEIGQRPEGEHI